MNYRKLVGLVLLMLVAGAAYVLGQRHPVPVADLRNTSPAVSANHPGAVPTPAIDHAGAPTNTRENGNKTAYIKRVSLEANKYYLTLDYVDWLGGKAAVQAALEDGDCAIEGLSTAKALIKLAILDENASLGEFGICTPNGFYIRNVNPKLRRLEVVPGVKVSYRSASLDLSELAKILNGEKLPYLLDHESEFKSNPYDIEVLSGRIKQITWRYVP